MKILYFANLSKNRLIKREEEIITSLESMGHKVLAIDETKFDVKNLIIEANKSDLFFFHHGGVITDSYMNLQLSLNRLELILRNITCKKIFWFTDKAIGMSNEYLEHITPLVDYGFLNDDTWVRRHKYTNLYPMHLAWGETLPVPGRFKKEFANDIVFVGNVYGARKQFVMSMKEEFGERFKVYNDKYGQDFADMCESVKIMVSPKSPFDDFYWSDRVYRTMISKGFLIHPRLEGLKEEFRQKPCLETYNSWEELVDKIKFWLRPENNRKRKDISQAGKNFVEQRFAYTNRLREILDLVK